MSAHGNTAFVPEGQLRPLNRRGFMIGAAVAGAMIPTAASATFSQASTGRASWDAAMARFRAAEIAEDQFYKQVYSAAGDAWVRHDVKIPVEIRDEMDRLTEQADNLRWGVMKMPAPDRAALRWKLEHVLRDDGSGGITAYASSDLDQTIADIGRLLGDA